jgi:hypothetical protein
VLHYELGDGTANPIVIDHGQNSWAVDALVNKNRGIIGLTTAAPGSAVIVSAVPNTPNQIVIDPDEAWGVGEMHLTLVVYAGSDTTAPDAPVISPNVIGATSISVTATTPAGTVGWNWFKGTDYVATTYAPAYLYDGLTPNNAYPLSVQGFDRAGNLSAKSAPITPSTTASPSAVFVSAGPGAANNNPDYNFRTTPPWVQSVGVGRALVGLVVVSHNGWFGPTGYDALRMDSDKDGSLPMLASIGIGVPNQNQGVVAIFGKLNATVGDHSLTGYVAESGFGFDGIKGASAAYQNVSAFGAPTVLQSTDVVPLNLAATTAVGNMLVLGVGMSAAPVGFNQTQRTMLGQAMNGMGDYMLLGDAPGTGAPLAFTTTNAALFGAIILPLIKSA